MVVKSIPVKRYLPLYIQRLLVHCPKGFYLIQMLWSCIVLIHHKLIVKTMD